MTGKNNKKNTPPFQKNEKPTQHEPVSSKNISDKPVPQEPSLQKNINEKPIPQESSFQKPQSEKSVPQEPSFPKNTSEKPPQKPTAHKSLIGVIACILALIALALAMYNLYRENILFRTLSQQRKPVMQAIQSLQKGQQSSQEALTQDKTTLTNKINALQTTIEKQQAQTTENWKVLKARYFLELAQIQTHWDEDPQTTIALLEQANTLLGQINNGDLFPIRQTLASEIAQLQAQPKLDISGMLSQLDALNNQVDSLTTIPAEKKLPSQNNQPNQESTWKQHWQNSLHALEKMVVIQKQNDETIKPILSNMMIGLLKESIRINLQEAKWGLLKRNVSVYANGLNQAMSIIQKHFDLQAAHAKAFLQQLNKLKEIDISIKKPPIQDALNQLETWIEKNITGQKE